MRVSPPIWLGVSLKMYFGPMQTSAWCEDVRRIAVGDPGLYGERLTLTVLPSFVSLGIALDTFRGSRVTVGAQDLAVHDEGAFTGEVSGRDLADLGCRYVEVGHAERRRLFGETEEVVAAKVNAAFRNSLVPILCVGEERPTDPRSAAAAVVSQVRSALGPARGRGAVGPLVVAYEPRWAIGQQKPAGSDYVAAVAVAVRDALPDEATRMQLVYGGSAGPGMLTELDGSVDGLFLGRFAHDPEALGAVLREVLQTTS
jgi:triosephosphate isomerase